MTKKPRPAKIAHPAMKTELWPLAKIKPYPNNPRTHPPAQIALLAALLTKRGCDQPIVVDEKGFILKGHGRLLSAELAKMGTFPVIQRFGLTDAEKVAIRIEDNAVPLLSGWDKELIAGELAILKHFGYELSLLGFGDAQLVQFTTQPGPPSEFQEFGENIPIDFECPACHHKWSGKPKPDPKPAPKPVPKTALKRGSKK